MKTKNLFVIILMLLPALCMAKGKERQDTISVRRAFVEMPAQVLDLLPKETRLDMLDYFDADSTYSAINSLRGLSTLETVTPDFLSVQLTPVSSMQIKVLKMKNGADCVMTIYTTGGDGEAKDSDIRFYDSQMKELPKDKMFKTPKLADFFDTKGYKTRMKEIEEILPFYTILFEANPDNSNVTGKLTLGDILTIEDQKIVELLMKPSVTFLWNGKEFRPTKL